MVAIVSGMQAGLNLGSREVLGSSGLIGNALEGRNGQGVYVNVGNGLLVVQKQDDLLVSRGHDAAVLRTYNSGGVFNDDNGDNWTSGVVSLRLAGALNAAGSTVQRVDRDGSTATYTFDAARNLYVTTEGAGAHDSIAYVAADAQFEWRDGSTGATQRFEGSGQYRLLASRDASGVACTYAYGAGGFLSSVTTASGESIFYDYAGANLSQVRTVAGGVTTTRVRYGYDAANRLAAVTVDLTPGDNSVADGKVYQTTYAYDGTSRRIATIGQSDGTSLAFTYVDLGGGNFKVASVRDGLNQTSTFAYGAGFTTVTDPLGLVTRYDYDAAGQLTKVTAPAVAGVAATKQFAYSASGDVASVTDGEGRSVTFQYDANGNQVLQRDSAGNTVTRTFDARNQLLTETVYRQPDPDGAGAALPGLPETTRHAYDAAGRNLLRFSVSAEGRVTEHRYNGFGERVAAITYTAGVYAVGGLASEAALSEAQLATWAATQNPTTTQRVDFAFDGRGQLQSRTSYARVAATGEGVADGSQSVERYVYDAAGSLLQLVSPANGTTSYTYDGLGRALSRSNALGQVELTQHDDAGRKTVVTLANGLASTSAYDAAGRLVSVAQSSAATGALGETRYFYDAGNRLRMTQDPTGVRSWVLYDEAGRKSADVDGNGTMTEYAYDRAGQVIRSITFGTAVNTTLLVDAVGTPAWAATAATVRPTESAGDAAIWRQYDAANRLVRMAEHSGTTNRAAVTEYRYDGASRLTEVVRYANAVPADGSTGSVAAGAVPLAAASAQDRSSRNFHDAEGRLAGTLDAEGYLTVFQYTAAGQVSERISYAAATNVALRATGSLAQLVPAASAGDLREVSLYDGKGQLVGQVDGEGYLTETVYDANGNLTQTVRYANRVTNAVGTGSTLALLRPAASASDRTTTRSYDALNRVATETNPEGTVEQFFYDAAGNLTSTVRAAGTGEVRSLMARFDVQGRLTAELSAQGAALLTGGQTQAQVDAIWAQYASKYTYDAASRRTSATDPLGNRLLFFYNADGALTHTVNPLGEVQENRYDARGRLTEQVAYASRISTAGLTGGLVPTALTGAVAGVANATQDSRTTFTYTRDSQTATTTDALGTVRTVSYNAFGDAISSQLAGTAVNLSETYSVDRRGLRTGTARDPSGVNAVSSSVYDAFGRLVRSVDASGNVREQTYDRLGRVISTRDPLNALRSTSYDAFGRVLTQVDAVGKTTSYAYNAAARTMTVTTAEGIATTTTYTRHGQVQSFADGKGQVTSYAYDRNGRLLQTATPLSIASSTFDAGGRVIDATDANGNKVAYTYDAASRVLTRRVDPDGLNLTTTFQYDGKGQRVAVIDANGVVTTIEYDRKGQVLKQTVDPTGLNLQTVYTYDAAGNTLTVRSPAGTVSQYVYDALGRRTQERVDPAGLNLQRSWSYDANGNARSATDARGNVTRFTYDGNDRLVFTLNPVGSLKQNSYDAEGRLVKTVAYARAISTAGLPAHPTAAQIQPLVVSQASLDMVEHRVYDKDGRVSATVDGTGAVVKYTYDANGNVVTRTAYASRINPSTWAAGSMPAPAADAARDQSTRTLYDGLNRAVYTVDGIGAVVGITYDGNGNVVQRTAYAAPIPTNTTFTSDALAAAVAAAANPARDASVRNTYDAAGRLVWTVNGLGAVAQSVYDKNGNVVRQVLYSAPVPPGTPASAVMAGANDRTTAMAYDKANRMVFQVDALRAVTEQVFDAEGHVLRRVSYANPIASVPSMGTAGSADAIRAAITVNPASDRSTRFGYDAAGRLVLTVDAAGSVTEAQYDAAGNRIAFIAYGNTVNADGLPPASSLAALRSLLTANAVLDRTSRSVYDAAGQLAYAVDAMRFVTAHAYDGAGRLVRSTRYDTPIAEGTAGTAAAVAGALLPNAADRLTGFAYDAAGRLIASTDALGGGETYTYDGLGHKLSFVNKKGSLWTYSYDAAGRMLSETSPQVDLTSVSVDANGNIVPGAATAAAVITRMAYDALGNLTQRTEAAGQPEERSTRYEYDALGRQVRVIFPPVGVYNAAGDPVTTNGATGLASRVETVQTLETRTFYDALGNAVASRDVGGGLSQKAYDLQGRVTYEVDALGYVTGYGRNAFGEVVTLRRYGQATTLANAAVTQASHAAGKAQVEAAINAAGVDHSRDRTLTSTYDRAGRVTEAVEASVFVYDSSAPAPSQTATAGKTTRNVYDAFGQRVQVKVLRNALTNTWSGTTSYFDKAGREIATIDALGYLTKRGFDSAGNLTEQTEYAAAVAASWTPTADTALANPNEDRTVRYTYDRLDRRISETRLGVEFSEASNGTSTRGEVTTAYEYDAVGNQTQVTDAQGNVTFTYFDALGRIRAVAAPSRSSTASGASLTPLSVFRRDAHGNVVVKTDHANGAALANASTFTAATDPADRTTMAAYDSHGHATVTMDATGASQFTSYDAFGHVTKKWQAVLGGDGVTRTAFELNFHDRLGQVIETRTPASTSIYQAGVGIAVVSQAQAGIVSTAIEYNAFGEVVRKGTQGGWQEYFDYDNAGRLWRTNTGDGIDRIQLYDLQGNVTADIRSSGSGRDNISIRGFASAEAAASNPSTRRVDVRYDALGRVTGKTEAARLELQGGVAVQRQFVQANVLAVGGVNDLGFNELKKVSFSWNSLAALGSGDVKVYIEYYTEQQFGYLDEGARVGGATPPIANSVSGVLNGDANASGAVVEWRDNPYAIVQITRIVVYKKDVKGQWQVVINQMPGHGSNEITVAAPSIPGSTVSLSMRPSGSTGDSGWAPVSLVDFGKVYRFDASALTPGAYEYRVSVQAPSELTSRVTASGNLSVTQPPLNNITTPIAYGGDGFIPAGMLWWATPGESYIQTVRYRVNGSSGAWNTLPMSYLTSSTGVYVDGVKTAGLSAGTYQFELLWTLKGQGVPTAHATGTFTVVAPVPSYWVPPVNLPHIKGLAIGTGVVGATITGYDENGAPIYSGGTTVPAVVWNAADATIARYRLSGGAWTYLAIDNSATGRDEYGTQVGTQKAMLNGIPPGTYQIEILKGSPATAQATGNLTIHAKTAGYWRTDYVQVQRLVQYGTDEYGTPLYRWEWVTEARQTWVEGTTPPPTIQITTPAYIAGYWTNPIPAQYAASVTTVAGSTAISTPEGASIGQTAGLNGDSRWLRPTVLQKTDRWGNVVEITDPRAAYWKTTYRYNANNQMVEQILPATDVAAPRTFVYYDKLGRQVAVKDANGNVNGQVFDAGGNLVQELHADEGVVTNAYNAFGDKVRTVDARGNPVLHAYDKIGRILSTTRGAAWVYSVNGANALVTVESRNITESWTYDQLGRKLSQTNGNGEVLRYTYDLAGNLVATQQPAGQVVRAAFDPQGRKTAEVDANGHAMTWSYDYFGRLDVHDDLGGERVSYTYDFARQLIQQTSTRGQNITYAYDAAGQMTTIRDASTDKTTTYVYDLSGRKVRERVVQGGFTYQDNHLAYDVRGNLRDVADARAHISMDYDAAGNRTRVSTSVNYQGTAGETSPSSHRYFKYDAMNRQVVVDAVDAAGTLGTQGHRIIYDKNGNRTSDTYWGNKVVTSGGERVFAGYFEDGVAIYTNRELSYTKVDGMVTEEYRYDALDRLQSVVRDDTQIDVRFYDGAGRVVQSGPAGGLPTKYAEVMNTGLAPDEVNGKELRINRYDANGRMLHQRVLKSDGSAKMDISWDSSESVLVRAATWFSPAQYVNADGYDNAGNVRGYVVQSWEGGYVNEYVTSLNRFEGYQAGTTTGTSTKLIAGSSTQQYDANGFLVGVVDSTQALNNRTFVNDASGRALFVNQAGNVQRQLIVNGELLGRYGVGVNQNNPASGLNNNPNFANVVDFDFGYSRVSADYPSASPGAYTVRTGDTLQSIAQSAYGDSSLWYRIADANGLGSMNDVKVGQTLNIPNRIATISNNNTTFKPYDPRQIEGDKAPSLATPKPKKKSWIKQLAMIVVAVVVAYFTGFAVLGTFTPVATTAAGAAVYSTGAYIVAGAVAGAAGSIASQVVGLATGVQDKFNWKGVALAAVGGGVSGGLGGFQGVGGVEFVADQVGNRIIQAAVGNALAQGIGVVTGLQDRFDWRGVAASAVGAGIGQLVGPKFGYSFEGRLATGLLSGAAAAVAGGGRVSATQVAIDAFGNALGQSIAENSSGATSARRGEEAEDVLGDFIAKNNNWAHVDVQAVAQQQRDALYGWNTGSDGIGFRPSTGVGTVGMRHQGLRSAMFDDTRVFSDSDDPNALVNVGQDGRPTAFLPVPPVPGLWGVAGGGAAAAGGYEVVRPRGAGGSPGYDLVRDMPSSPPASLPASPSLGLGLGAPPQQVVDKPWFDRAIEGMPIGVRALAGLAQIITTKVGEALGTTPAQGGTYVLRDEDGNVVRSGRSNDLDRRQREHFRDPALSDYTFEPVHRTGDYREQRGLEHKLHETYNPPLNKIRPISPSNPRMPEYLDSADAYLRRRGK